MVEIEDKKPNITTQVIPESSVATVVETHSKVDIVAIEIDK